MSENPIGRPSKYKPEYCQMLIDHMGSGLSYESFAAVIKVNRDTIYAWEKEYPDFSDAKKIAWDQNLLFWEKLGVDHVLNETLDEENEDEGVRKRTSKSLNATVWIFNMKNRHKWGDKIAGEDDHKVTLDGKVEVQQNDVTDRISQLKGDKWI